jgi:ribosome biogenesis GTPase
MKLEELGFCDWFVEKLTDSRPDEYSLARVIAVNKENYTIRNEQAEIPAEVTGKLMFGARSPLDLPAVGDWVYVQYFNEYKLAIIHKILPRKSLLKRKVAGKKIEHQLIASNIDVAFIMQSAEFDFNIPRLERYLTMANEADIQPVILLSKRDLISPEELEKEIQVIQSTNPGYETIPFSNKTGEGLEVIHKKIKKGLTYCLLGSSGVGKTTLINKLIGGGIFATKSVREKNGKGKHATARRQLIILERGGMIIDTPGMRELGNIGVETGIKETFAEIFDLAQDCRFNDCTHTDEPECAVKRAVENRELPAKRYQNYLKIRKESEFFGMSYLEKRKKDRKFGKLIKEVMKEKKNR